MAKIDTEYIPYKGSGLDEIVSKVNADLTGLLRDPAMIRQFEERATLPSPMTPAQFSAFITKDMATWAEVVKATGTKPGN
jgi:tripartite-type tricarboxylate transporter receptor subunit TctC